MYLDNFYLDLTLTKLRSNCLVSVNQGMVFSRANNSINFQPIFTNEVSKFKLRFSLSTNLQFVNSSDFRAEPFFSKLVQIFLGHPPCM